MASRHVQLSSPPTQGRGDRYRTFAPHAALAAAVCLVATAAGAQTIAWREGAQAVGASQGSPRRAEVASDGARAAVVWGIDRVWFASADESSPRWTEPRPLDDGRGPVHSAQIALSGTRALALWCQTITGTQHVMSAASADRGATWAAPVALEAAAGIRLDHPRLTLAGQTAVAAWYREEAGVKRLVSARSSDAGQTWSAPVIVTEGGIRDLALAASSTGRPVALWTQDDGDGGTLLASVSTDGGATWQPPRPVAEPAATALGGAWAYLPALAVEGNLAAALWCQDEDGSAGVFYSASTDGGATWATPRRLGGGAFPRLALMGGRALCAWSQGNSVAAAAGNATDAANWNTPHALTAGNRPLDNPALSARGKQALLLWRQGFSIWGCRSADGGATWQKPRILETLDTNGWYPNGTFAGRRAVAFWMQWLPDLWMPFGNWSDSAADAWQGPVIVAEGAGDGWEPALAADGERALAIWPVHEEDRGRLRVVTSADGGITWSPSSIAAEVNGRAGTPALVLAGTRAVAVWSESRGADGAAMTAVASADGGLTWSAPIMLANDARARLGAPAVAADGAQLVAVWQRMDKGAGGLVVARSGDSGQTWGEAVAVATDGDAVEPQVAVYGRNVLLTWTRRETGGTSIQGALSSDGGATWGTVLRFDGGNAANSAAGMDPAPTGCPDGPCLCPLEGRPSCRPADVGRSAIAADGNRLLVVWHQRDAGAINRIHASASADGGRTWSPAAPVTPGYGNVWGAQPGIVEGRAFVFWRQREEKQDVLHGAVSADGGLTWSPARRLGSGITDAPMPDASRASHNHTQINAFVRTANVPPGVLAVHGSRAVAARMIRETDRWVLLVNTGTVGGE